MNDFERKLWGERASFGGIRSTSDLADAKGLKNIYIDLTYKTCLGREMSLSPKDKVLDFGCGLGRLSAWVFVNRYLTGSIILCLSILTVATFLLTREDREGLSEFLSQVRTNIKKLEGK